MNQKVRYLSDSYARESWFEKAVLLALRKYAGALTYKFVSPQKKGVPDDIVLLKDGRTVFVEFKCPDKNLKPTKLQQAQIEKIRNQGHHVVVLATVKEAEDFIHFCVTFNRTR